MKEKRMNYIENGHTNKDTIILLHGGGLSWWNYRKASEKLSSDYRVILPILEGHTGSDAGFTTIEHNAAEIISFIDEHFGGSVLLIGGVSLGGQILLDILSQRMNICRYALIESALVIPSRFLHAMIPPAFGSCHGLIRHQWFSRLQFRSLRIHPEFFEEYYRDTCGISKSDMIAFLQANSMYSLKESVRDSSAGVYVFVGEKENKAMRRSAEIIHETLPGSTMHILPGLYHGQFSLNCPENYVKTVLKIIGKPESDISSPSNCGKEINLCLNESS